MKAFPHTGSFGPDANAKQGMDLRDWFAGQALAGLCADGANEKLGWTIDVFAKSAYQIADAMMSARNNSDKGLN